MEMNEVDREYITKKTFVETQEKQIRWEQSSENREELIQRELSPLQQNMQTKETLIQSIQGQLEKNQQDLTSFEKLLEEKKTKKMELKKKQEGIELQLQQVRNSLEEIVSERKRLWRENEVLNTDVDKLTTLCVKEKSELNKVVGYSSLFTHSLTH